MDSRLRGCSCVERSLEGAADRLFRHNSNFEVQSIRPKTVPSIVWHDLGGIDFCLFWRAGSGVSDCVSWRCVMAGGAGVLHEP